MKLTTSSIVIAICHAAVARAQPAGAQAEVLFREGRELLAKGQIAEACDAFDASEKLDPSTSTVLNQANCREKNGQLASAWGLYLEAERTTRDSTDAASKQLHDLASASAAKLEPRLSTLTITVSDDARVGGLEVVRDKDVVDVGAWNKALPIDGGTYRIVARAPGNAEWSTSITVAAERDVKAVEIPQFRGAELAHPAHANTATTPPAGAEADDDNKTDATPTSGRSTHWVPFAVGGSGVALLGTAVVLELVAESTHHDSETALDRMKQTSLWHTANTERDVAIGFAAAGAVATSVAVWLYLRDRRTDRGVAIAPMASSDRVGLSLTGGFR